MSTKNNAFVIGALAAAGLAAVNASASPVLETLLNDYKVRTVNVVQVDQLGRCMVFAGIESADAESVVVRPVANASGDIKLYSDIGAVTPLLKRAKLTMNAEVRIFRKLYSPQLANPIATLKTQYKSFKSEKLVVDKAKVQIDAQVVAVVALGYDQSNGTPERAEYDDYLARRASVNEAIAYCAARITALAASLRAAGFDPETGLVLPPVPPVTAN